MKKRALLLFVILICFVPSSFAQLRSPFHITTEGYVDFDLKYGSLTNDFSRVALESAYNKPVNISDGKYNFSNSKTIGFDAKVGYFLNDKKTWGVTLGLSYFYQSGRLNLDTFHIEYSSLDSKKRVFRQLVSSHSIGESISANNINIPFMLHYQIIHRKRCYYTVDAGILYNITMSYDYAASGSFDYEAIYKYNTTSKSFVYDNSPVVSGPGYIPMTINQYYATNPKGKDLVGYFNELSQKWGANIGLNQPITNKTGSVSYQHGSVGYIIEPCVNYQISDLLFLKFGLYYIYQVFDNNGNSNKNQLTAKFGDYNGLLNETSSISSSSFGINIGVKMILRDKVEESLDYVSHF